MVPSCARVLGEEQVLNKVQELEGGVTTIYVSER